MNRITSIGEILFDVYRDGKTPGGAPFNFLYHIKKLTGEGNFVSRVGNDKEGVEIINLLKENNLSTEYLQIDSEHPTGEATPTLDEKKIPSWNIKNNAAYDFIELTGELKELIAFKTDCLYFGTLAQRNAISGNTIHRLFYKDLIYFCDLNIRQNFYTKDLIMECISASDILKLNTDELRLLNELILNKNFDPYDTPRRLMNEYEIKLLCVTEGDQGASLFNKNEVNHFKTDIDNVVDTVGAGDAYAAILCIGYLQKWNIEKINHIASEFAGEIVKINGAIPEDSQIYYKFKSIINSPN